MAEAVDVLVVGAGPTGLALAAQLLAFGASVRIIDRRPTPVRESRALIIQPRTLEMLQPIGVTPALIARGETTASARLHLNGRAVTVAMHDTGLVDTPYPFLLVLRQAQTEAVLRDHLRDRALGVEWSTEFLSRRAGRAGLVAVVRHADGAHEPVDARYVAGCDGAGSTVRRDVGIEFVGAAYDQSVLLADVAIDAELSAEPVHAFVSPHGGAGAVRRRRTRAVAGHPHPGPTIAGRWLVGRRRPARPGHHTHREPGGCPDRGLDVRHPPATPAR